MLELLEEGCWGQTSSIDLIPEYLFHSVFKFKLALYGI
jgi:hypothetical protein